MKIVETNSLEETYAFGRRFAQRLRRGDCIALVGELGAGKTALARGIAMGLGLADERIVSSPTFVLVQEYPTQPKLFHVDLYRLRQPEIELADLGLDEMLEEGIVLIEWADRAKNTLPKKRWEIEIQSTGATERKLTVDRIG
jgi:tRNA threonylcarbamoyl adenosine modification protein YjeE